MSKKIVITGANSYLGSYISDFLFRNTDFELILIHSLRSRDENFVQNERIKNFKADLSSDFPSDLKAEIQTADKLFHFAWLRGKKENSVYQKNEQMILQLIENLEKPENLFFISSVSGTPNTKSEYGKNKYKALKLIEEKNGNSIILGLVMEDNPKKGPYKMLETIASKLPFSFRLNKNETLTFPIKKENFAKVILNITLNSENTKQYGVFETAIGFNSFMETIEQKFPRKRIKLSFNANFVVKVASIAKRSKLVPVKICDQILTFFYKDADFLLNEKIFQYEFLTNEKNA